MAALSPAVHRLKCRWNDYLKITQDDRNKKVVALDLFLKEFLCTNRKANTEEDDALTMHHEFSDMKSVSNLLAGELLIDVHHVCSTSADDDTSHLQQYLLHGRGATLLKVLNTISVEGVSCNRELGDLLATLLPLCCKFPCAKDVSYTGGDLPSIDSCFSHLLRRKAAKSISKFPTLTEVSSSSTTHNVDVHTPWPPQRLPVRKTPATDSDGSTDSGDEDVGPRTFSGVRFRKSGLLPQGGVGKSAVLGVFPGILQDQPDEDGPTEPTHDPASFNVKLDPLELCVTMLELMQSLCCGDRGQLAQTRVVSFLLLPHLSHLLLSLVTEIAVENPDLAEGWTIPRQLQLIRSLTRTTVTVMSQASMQPNGVAYLVSQGCVLQLVEAAKVIARGLKSETLTLGTSDLQELLFVDDVMYGLLMLIHTMLQSLPLNPSILSSSLKLLNELCDHGLQLVQVVLVHWEQLLSSSEPSTPQHALAKEHVVAMVSGIGHVMSSLKKAKVDYIHMMKCLKRRHRCCDFSHYFHHHHDILGISSSAFAEYLVTMSDSYGSMEMLSSEVAELSGQSECSVAVLGDFLFQVLADAQTRLLQIRMLSCIEEAGLCCCMPPGRVQRHLLQLLEKQTPSVRSYVLCVLTKVLMDFCGGSEHTQQYARSICLVCRDIEVLHLTDSCSGAGRDPVMARQEASDSALSSSEASLHESSKICHPKWQCLRQFLPLLRHKNEALSIQVTQHLLRLISQASSTFKQQIFNSVFLPLLRQLKKGYLDPGGDAPAEPAGVLSETVVQYCLSALPLLLHSRVAQDLFHNSGGVHLLQAMIKNRGLRKCVLKVFQVLIVLEERSRRTMGSESQVSPETEAPDQKGPEPTDTEADTDGSDLSVCDAFMKIVLAHSPYEEQSSTNDTDSAQTEQQPREKEQPTLSQLPTDRHDLSIMCDVWNACATLFPCSQQFQQHFLQSQGHSRALAVLRSAFDKVVSVSEDDVTTSFTPGKDRGSPFQCWLALIESTLFLCLSCSSTKIPVTLKEFGRDELLAEVRGWLQRGRRLSSSALRAVCDMMLSCATTHRNMHDIVTNHTFAVMHLRIDDSDEQELSEVSDYCSTAKESETCHTEQGYEADSEFTPDEHTKLESRSDGRQVRTARAAAPTHVVHHPELARLVLELLTVCSPALPPDGVLAHLLLRLISFAKQSAHIASILYNQGLVEVVLGGIKRTVSGGPQYSVERRLLLDLFLLISQHAFSSKELAAFLDLFKNITMPTEALLSAATALAEAFRPKPTYILVFPVLRARLPTFELSVRSLSSDMVNASLHTVSPSTEEQQKEYDELLRTSNVQEAIDMDTDGSVDSASPHHSSKKSPVVCAPIHLNLQDSLQWPTADRAFSVSLWLQLEGTVRDVAFVRRSRRLNRSPLENSAEASIVNPETVLPARLRAAMSRSASARLWSEQCLHLASLGSEKHRAELWIEPETGSIICRRIVRPEGVQDEVVSGETCLASLLGFGCWEHLAVNYQEYSKDGSKRANVTAYVNGCYSRESIFDLKPMGSKRKTAPTSDLENQLMVGHSLTPEGTANSPGCWHLGNMMLFKDAVLSQSVSFHLFTLGPDCCSVSQCDSAALPTDYPRHVTRDLLQQSTLNLDMFTTNQTVSLQALRENLVVMYTPAQLATFNLYHPVSTSRARQTQAPSAATNLNHQPALVAVNFLTDVAAQAHSGLGDAVKELGGIGVFLYLFAWVVEHSDDEQEQAQALKLLFTLISRNPHHAREFSDMGGYAMLAKVLGSDRCIIGYPLLKVLLDAMVTRPILRYDNTIQEYALQEGSAALIRDVHVVSKLLLAWRVWERGPVHVWHMAFRALESLLRDDHPHQQFNARQMHNIGIVDELLLICLERIQDSYPSLPIPICQSILNITASMLGHPPDVHIIMTICDFLLLIHPAASTYINHTPDEFYFIQKWAGKPGARRTGHRTSQRGADLTSTPVQRASTNVVLANKDVSSQVTTGQLSRSQSLPTVSESPPRAEATGKGGAEEVDNSTFLTRFMELDNMVPALVVDTKKRSSENLEGPVELLYVEGKRSSPGDLMRTTSEEPVTFYVDTGSEHSSRSSTCSTTALPDHNQTTTVTDKNRNNADNSPERTASSGGAGWLDIYSQDMDSPRRSQRGSPTSPTHGHSDPQDNPTSEDENGNSVVSSNHSATRDLLSRSPMLSSSAPECLEDVRVMQDLEGGSAPSPTDSVRSAGDTPVEEEEKGLVHISVGLLDLLCNILVLLPENDLSKILGVILKPETLLVMVHHQAPEIRNSIIRLLDMFFHRANVKQKEQFVRQQGFHLLASQLYQHAATQPLLEACFTVLFARPHALEDDFDPVQLADMGRLQKQAIIPILALLESTVCSIPMAHSTLVLLVKLLEHVDCLMPVMLENALIETLCNVVGAIHASPPRYNDAGADERYVIIEDLQHFFAVIAERTFSTSGVAYYQHFEDSLTLLHALEISETARYGLESEEVGNVRNMRAHVLRAVFDYVITRLESATSTGLSHSSFSTTVGSLLSFLPARRPEGTHDDSSSPPSDGRSRRRPRRSAPAHLAHLQKSSSDSYHSDSPSSVSDWSIGSTRSPSVATKGFHGNKKMEIGQGELLERFKKVVVLASDFVMYSVPRQGKQTYVERRLTRLVESSIEIVSFEKDFARFLVEFLFRGIVSGMERSFFQRKTLSNSIMWQAKDVLRIQFSHLVAHLVASNQALGQRLFVVDLLMQESKCVEVLKLTINICNLGQKLVFYMYELLVSHLEQLTRPYRQEVDDLMTCLEKCGLRALRIGQKVSTHTRITIEEDQRLWQAEARREKAMWLKKHEAAKLRLLSRLDAFARRISGCAMEFTQAVVNAQNAERRKFVEHVKTGMSHRLSVKKSWQQLIQQLSHERAVWHCPDSYPTSWQLDPTEGPCRVRRRTQRCHLSIGKKYLVEGYQEKLDAEAKTPPLSYLFEEDVMSSDSAALIYRLHTNEKIQHTCRCQSVTPSSETPGELLLGQSSVYFVGDEAIMDANYTQVLLGNKDLLSMTLPNEDITEVHKRWYQLKDMGLEIFLTNGKTSLLAFENTKERDAVYRLIMSQELPSLIHSENLAAIQQMWLDRRMTNFEYLTHLNKMAGRSFNDLMQYPVFPFVLANYESETLDLDAFSTYRNLAKPISVQHKDREEKYIENYKWLLYEKQKMSELEPTVYQPDPYHYGSHYSNSGTVLHFLVRVPPFTQMFLVYQDKNFDLPDRTFHSMHTAWKLASFQSTTDVKELIPEFFFLPEFLQNSEGFAFGVRQDNVRVWDVLLPPWCRGDPRLFTLLHRHALESDYVTQHLAAWLDLVFGAKQTGKAAIEAVNVFHPATYFGTDVEAISDPVRRTAIKTMIKTYGQTPKLLFKMPHPTPQLPRSSTKDRSSVMKNVTGVRWGNYVGSPDHPDPVMAWSQNHGSLIASLVALPTEDVFGLRLHSSLLVMYSKEKGITAVNTTDVLWAAIISWNHPDGIIRIQNRRNAPPVNLLSWGVKDKVTCCASVPDCRLLFFGSTSGVITVFNTKFNADKASNLQVFGRRQCLYGHGGAVTAMCVCKPYSVLVTASRDNTAIIWDLNRLCYVRSISEHQSPVQLVSVSDTTGDIATVSHAAKGSVLKLHTINAALVGSVRSAKVIHCLAFSNAPEGRSVNIIACGLSNGTIRFWNSWDLSVVRDLTWDRFTKPIVSLTFTHDSQRLYASDSEGTVAVFEKPRAPGTKGKPVNFISFL